MLRVLAFLAAVGVGAWGLAWLADIPGGVSLTWRGAVYGVSLGQAVGLVCALGFVLAVLFSLLGFVLRIPALVALASRARRRGSSEA